MEWWRTLVWIVQGNPWGVVLMVVWVVLVLAFVPPAPHAAGG